MFADSLMPIISTHQFLYAEFDKLDQFSPTTYALCISHACANMNCETLGHLSMQIVTCSDTCHQQFLRPVVRCV